MIDLISVFIFFIAVIDPIGTVPVFIAVTRNEDERSKRRIAIRAVLISTAILTFFVIAGELILDAMDIPLPASLPCTPRLQAFPGWGPPTGYP